MAKSTKKIVARSGRFAKAAAREANAFTASVGFDYRLAPYDIAGSIAHARMLHHVGLLKKKERYAGCARADTEFRTTKKRPD